MNQPGTTIATLTDKLLAIKEGHIGWIVFNNPEKRSEEHTSELQSQR